MVNLNYTRSSGCVRIIGGRWRGRKLRFPMVAGLRPTPARVRETVFNWLAPTIVGANCLDLFAGSGALGLEALSRGANYIVLLDRSPKIVQYLHAQLSILQAEAKASVQCLQFPYQTILMPVVDRFDIVFLDPPFRQNRLAYCCYWLEQQGYLAVNASIYIECETSLESLSVPTHWRLAKDKRAGQVRYCLFQRECTELIERPTCHGFNG